jgi:hypothetical protein
MATGRLYRKEKQMRLIAKILAAIVAAPLSVGGASAQQQKQIQSWGFGGLAPRTYTTPRQSNQGGAANKLKQASLAPLTKEECEGLGGIVTVNFHCKSMSICTTVSPNGVVRRLCINK